MKRFKELQESLRSEGAETYTVSKGTYTRKVDGKTADLLKKQGWKLMSREEAEEEVTEGFLGKDGEKGRDIKNAGLFDKETAYSLAKKVNGVIHKDPKSDKYHVKHGKGSNVREESVEEALEFHVRLDHLDGDKRQKKVTDLLKKHQDAGHISFSGETDKGIVFTSKSKSYIDDVRKDLKPYGVLVDESVDEASSTSPNMAKAVQGLNDLGYKLKGRDGKDVQRVEKLFRSGNKKVLQGAIRALDTDIRDQIMDILEPLGFVKDGVVEAMNEENVKKGDSVKIINAKKYDALSKPEVSGIVIGMAGSKVMVKVGSGQMNVDPKDLVKESVELDESTAAYAASLEKMANDKQLKGLTKSDRDTLSRLAAMMAKEKKPMKEALSPAFNNSYIGMPDAILRRKRNAFLDQINDLIKFKKKNKGDKEVVDLEDKVRQINYAMSHKAK